MVFSILLICVIVSLLVIGIAVWATSVKCAQCRTRFLRRARRCCPRCGSEIVPLPKRVPDFRKLAKRQRWIIWLVLASMTTQIAPFFAFGGFGSVAVIILVVLQIVIHAAMIVGAVLVLVARRAHVAVIILAGILMLAPCVNLFVLVVINVSATRTLRRTGVRVRFMGVDPEELERVLNTDLCKGCGYNLTGNVSGICPECGRSTERHTAEPSPRTSG